MEKKNTTSTIEQLFKSSEAIRIPAYQRAYSWESKECAQFLEDLLEQKGKKYYLGQFLFEDLDNTFFIIDGQQRLTTSILFFSAIAKILKSRNENTELLTNCYLTDVFETISDDQVIFRKITRKHQIPSVGATETISQKRLIEAFGFFEKEINNFDQTSILELQSTLENAVISTLFINDKIEATQVFEYQNNRGKDLTRFEVVKAFLMHQVYVHISDVKQANQNISDIQRAVSQTYRYIEAVEGYFSENELLDNYCNLFFNIHGSIEAVKERLGKEDSKATWIKSFFENLAEFTLSARSILNNKSQTEIMNLFFVGNEANWKLVLLAIFYKGEASGDTYKRILKLLEVLCFKLKLGDYRTDTLPTFTKKYFTSFEGYNIDSLYQDVRHVTENGFQWYWNHNGYFSGIISNYFDNQPYHYHRNIIKYVLWQYENEQRLDKRSGALLDKDLYESYTIEHIKPQKPSNEAYSDEFVKNHLHRAGNLALLTQSQNSSFGNKTFEEKANLFQDTALTSYAEIREKRVWTEFEIEDRHRKISDFAKRHFDISKI